MGSMKFTATKLSGTGKLGSLKPDADGYYTVVLGGLNTLNSGGQYYDLQGAEHLFLNSSAFMRRVQKGCLMAEVGHPKRDPKMTDDDYVSRLLNIEETNTCCHIAEVWLDHDYGRNNPQFNNPNLVAIMGKLKPAGPKSQFLKEAFENNQQNIYFSIRSFTNDFFQKGKCFRVLETIVTFDYVIEGGIANASKWSSPTLEELSETTVTHGQIKRFLATESYASMEDSKSIAMELLTITKPPQQFKLPAPGYAGW